jgi:alginate O-acetyltransferase complex protein AlgI
MTFNSLNFLIFFPVVIVIYNLTPQRGKVWLLLASSYFFFINLQPIYALLLVAVTLCTYFFARAISKSNLEKHRRNLLVLGIILIILPLFFFKYFGFINNSIVAFLNTVGLHFSLPKISLMLPIGISFYTFMAIGYIVDVHNEDVEFEPRLESVGLFLSFFPIILSGPIERAGNMLTQFKKLENSTYDDLVIGGKMMLWGYFMKLCVADRLGLYIDAVFNNIQDHNGTTLGLASILYPFQVYADLGGYSFIAIGVARCLGIKVIPNFNRPFFATSMSEFWRRWHMSLIQWLTDYIYTPLSFVLRKWKIWGIVTALMITFLISGIWHGAALTFIVWGFVQGVYLSIEALINKSKTTFEQKHHLKKNPLYISACCVAVFILFAFSQIFGKCPSVNESLIVIKKIITESGSLFMDVSSLTQGFMMLAILLLVDFIEEFYPNKVRLFKSKSILVRYASCVAVSIIIILFGVFDGGQFIYFQF